jgi:hypothetical protein
MEQTQKAISALKLEAIRNVVAYSCCNIEDNGLYSGNIGMMLTLFESAQLQDDLPLNHYTLGVLERTLGIMQRTPDSIALGWIISEGHKRKYFDLDDEDVFTPFDRYFATTQEAEKDLKAGAILDTTIHVKYCLNRWDALNGNGRTLVLSWISSLSDLLINASGESTLIGSADINLLWILYSFFSEMQIQDEVMARYVRRLLEYTYYRGMEIVSGEEGLYSLWQIVGLIKDVKYIADFRQQIYSRLKQARNADAPLKIRALEDWGVLQYLFYPGSGFDDCIFSEYVQKIAETDWVDALKDRIERRRFGLDGGVCSLITIL